MSCALYAKQFVICGPLTICSLDVASVPQICSFLPVTVQGSSSSPAILQRTIERALHGRCQVVGIEIR